MSSEAEKSSNTFNLSGFSSLLPKDTSKPSINTSQTKPTTTTTTTTTSNIIKATTSQQTDPKSKSPVKPEPGKEGMAAQFEDIYLKINHDLKKLEAKQQKVSKLTFKDAEASKKTLEDLKNENINWTLNDVDVLSKMIDSLTTSAQDYQPEAEELIQLIQTIATESSKFLNKKEDIKTLLTDSRCESSSEILKNRELDPELKTSLASLETKFRDLEGTMNALEVGVLEEMKRNRIQEDDMLTYYSVNRKICDIQKEISERDNDILQLEEKVAEIKLKESSRKAYESSSGFACIDLSDDEEEEDLSDTIQYTTKYIRRFNFLHTLYEASTQRQPISYKKHE
ncbi:hypothetical protein G6F70_003562 [Rhizopus microsporus]|nr:hypothetical protein G6F71_005197 [Rhizopus microsporus]KAG1200978.1 hypothetical protein G6F70_003562 [Rhizopus microsporus]KAG1213520.1 hypothetical protein G6F69_002755 [Rhizopus microsporus]KAG1232603.1 hypothetical protein G6F67_004889 [Rhizopus microsporus]KAG1265617.1 hypothetical protein G6F68_003430 [Rhizopus microsporus]